MVELRAFKVQRDAAATFFTYVAKYQKCIATFLTFVGHKSLLLLPFTNIISIVEAQDIRVLLDHFSLSLEQILRRNTEYSDKNKFRRISEDRAMISSIVNFCLQKINFIFCRLICNYIIPCLIFSGIFHTEMWRKKLFFSVTSAVKSTFVYDFFHFFFQ